MSGFLSEKEIAELVPSELCPYQTPIPNYFQLSAHWLFAWIAGWLGAMLAGLLHGANRQTCLNPEP